MLFTILQFHEKQNKGTKNRKGMIGLGLYFTDYLSDIRSNVIIFYHSVYAIQISESAKDAVHEEKKQADEAEAEIKEGIGEFFS